jgi:hypothetical protein
VHKRQGNLAYTIPGAVGSLGASRGTASTASQMDARFDRILQGKAHPFFCSQLVVMVYQFAGEQNGISGGSLFPFSDPKVSPSTLAGHLHGSPMFGEAGYMLPHER